MQYGALSPSVYILSTTGDLSRANLLSSGAIFLSRKNGALKKIRESKKGEEATFAGRIKLAMAAAGIGSPAELARRMKSSRQTVHNYLSGQRDNPEPTQLFRLADVLHVNPRWLALGPPHAPGVPMNLAPEEQEALEIRASLDGDAREQWLSNGRTMVRLTAKASTGNPFPMRRSKA